MGRSIRISGRWLLLFCFTFLVLLGGTVFLLFTPLPKKIYRGIVGGGASPGSVSNAGAIYRDKEIIKEVLVRDPLPQKFVSYKSIDTTRLWNGIDVNSSMEVVQGKAASTERNNPEGYVFDFQINVKVPKAVNNIAGLVSINPKINKVIPHLERLVSEGKVSGFYHKLYEVKSKRIQQFITRLNAVPDRHNFYDCETILELVHPDSKRKVFFMQSDMDVVSDGSDGDRMPEYDQYIAESTNYQPFTSYGWRKKTSQPNPLLARWKDKLVSTEKELAAEKVSSSLVNSYKQSIAKLKREIEDMKARSFLIARADPFVVIPSWMMSYGNQNEFAPAVGDYVAVVFKGRILPAIIGDTGPTWKAGEASLRIAKEVNPKSTSYKRPVSDLTVSYLIFPGSGDPSDVPDLNKWHTKVGKLLEEIGGLGEGFSLHRWSSYFD